MAAKIKEVALDQIVLDAGTQFRASANEQRIQDYAELLVDGDSWPFDTVCDVVFDGTSYYLVDGFHRYLAAARVERESIKCNVRSGSLRDAIKSALSANSRHGLHRSNEDKRKAVKFALADEEWSKLSGRAIAELCGVSHQFVLNVSLENNSDCQRLTPINGKARQATSQSDSPRQQKTAKAEPIYEDLEDIPDEEPTPEPEPVKKSKAEQALDNACLIAEVRQLVYGLERAMKAVPVVLGTELYHARLKRMLDMVEPLPGALKACEPYRICGHCSGKKCPQCGNHGWVSSSVKE